MIYGDVDLKQGYLGIMGYVPWENNGFYDPFFLKQTLLARHSKYFPAKLLE